jgi:hypothetical protein
MTLRTARWALALLTLLGAPALAWGPEGHHVVGSMVYAVFTGALVFAANIHQT